ncbi:MAG: endonuclease III [Treponema sp.]|jgi:endonuclease-3|nr:endonuclease III [Treponema sp.]
MSKPEWDGIFVSLETWRKELHEALPAVTTVAASYKRDPWAVIASTILSLRTKDDVTFKTSQALLEKAPTPAALLALSAEEVERLAYPAGFYRTKSANLLKIAAIIESRYGGAVPADMDALLALPGVGRKTANLVITEAFDMDGICVDIHVHRINNRAGWVKTQHPEQTEMRLRDILPRPYWKRINDLLVQYGQRLCRPVSPFCSKCVIKEHCERNGVERSR